MDAKAAFLQHFREMADYNRWANARIYGAAMHVSDEELHRDVGVYFSSLFGTLTHLLQTDRAWTFLLQGGQLGDMKLPPAPDNFVDLEAARKGQDARFIAWMHQIDFAWLTLPFTFSSSIPSWKGMPYEGTHGSTLSHLFNHQTHHRGQAHSALSLLGGTEPPALDILVKGMLRE